MNLTVCLETIFITLLIMLIMADIVLCIIRKTLRNRIIAVFILLFNLETFIALVMIAMIIILLTNSYHY